MKKLMSFSLKAKIITMSLFLCALMAAGGFLSLKKIGSSFDQIFYRQQENRAANLSAKISAQFFERYGDIQAFALNPLAKQLDGKKLPNYLDAYVKLYGIYDVILVVDKNGNFIASNTKDTADKALNIENLKTINFKSAPWFAAAIEGKWTSDKSKGFDGAYFEDVHFDPIYEFASSEKRTGTSFTSAITDETGQVVGVITNRASNKWFEAELASSFAEMKKNGFPDAEVTLINKDGIAISNLAPKSHSDKIEFDKKADNTIFKTNFFKDHIPAGGKMEKHQNGAVRSLMAGEDSDDLIGYAYIDGEKFINSIGWTVAVHFDANHAFAVKSDGLSDFYILTSLFALMGLVGAVWFGFSISKSVTLIIGTLTHNSAEVADASLKIAEQSAQLSESASEQAAALQETVAAVDEISAMVEKNADAAEKSKQMSASSRDTATKGRQTVENMMVAVNDINAQNDEISHQMQQTNSQLMEITKLINDIGTKTKVINEIVFQTKLLSFNASVEAARAGEYGKGFAVVAEEVGNLAQMSGNAAKEITEMLSQSVSQVESIIGETKTRVDRLMFDSRKKVEIGTETAKDCNEALEEILVQVSGVDALVSEISVASQEQSTGIREISKAVGQMEEVTQQNSSVAQASSLSADALRLQSTQLKSLVRGLANIISGSGNHQPIAVVEKNSSDNGKVVAIDRNRNAQKKFAKGNSEERFNESFSSASLQKASGSDSVPSSNDPGFDS